MAAAWVNLVAMVTKMTSRRPSNIHFQTTLMDLRVWERVEAGGGCWVLQTLQGGSGNAALQVKAEQNDSPLNRLQIMGMVQLRLLLQNIKCLFSVSHRWDIIVLYKTGCWPKTPLKLCFTVYCWHFSLKSLLLYCTGAHLAFVEHLIKGSGRITTATFVSQPLWHN